MCNYCNICSPRLIEINLIVSLKQPINSVKGSQGQHIAGAAKISVVCTIANEEPINRTTVA